MRFGLLPVRSPLLGESLLFSLPAGTKMFQFPAYASAYMADAGPSARRVVPFGNPRITGHLRLPAAYRSLSRPSSPARAKASPVRPFSLPRVHLMEAHGSAVVLLDGTPPPTHKEGGRADVSSSCVFYLLSADAAPKKGETPALPVSTCQWTSPERPPAGGRTGSGE